MTHKAFIEKMERYQSVAEFYKICQSFADTGNNFGITPRLAAVQIKYFNTHQSEPRCEMLAESTHYSVLKLSEMINLSSPETTRSTLVEKYRCHNTTGPINRWPTEIPRATIKQLFKAFDLNWFELDGYPYLHWNQV